MASPPAIADLTAYEGDTWAQTFRFVDDGVPVDLSAAVVEAWARTPTGATQPLTVAIGATPGEVTIGFPEDGLPFLSWDDYRYDVEVAMDGSVRTWVRGRLKVMRGVTNTEGGSVGDYLTQAEADARYSRLGHRHADAATLSYRFAALEVALYDDVNSGTVALDASLPGDATVVHLSRYDWPGTDWATILQALTAGDSLRLQDEDDSTVTATFEVMGAPVPSATGETFTVPVEPRSWLPSPFPSGDTLVTLIVAGNP